MAISRKTFTEINECKCGHGRARHSEVYCMGGMRGAGYLCLLPDCHCWNFNPKPEDLYIPEEKNGVFAATARA